MKALAILALGFLLLSASAFAENTPQLKAEIRTFHLGPSNKAGVLVSLNTKITNVGKAEQSLLIWSCSYPEHWKSDNPAVEVKQVDCDKNALIPVTLKAGEVYERELSVEVKHDGATFRLGFEPGVNSGDSRLRQSVIWSNDIAVAIFRD